MKRNYKKYLRAILSLALAAVMCVTIGVTAFAKGEPIYGTEEKPAEAAITKVLQMPVKTTTPNSTFTFEVARTSFNGNASDVAKVPAIADQNVTFTPSETSTPVNGTITMKKETASLFKNVNWTAAGVYTYMISEKQNTNPSIDNPANSKEEMIYSNGQYEVNVYVRNGANGGFYVYAIAAIIKVVDNPGQEVGDKVNPTPGGDPTVEGDYSDMVFTNTYLEKHKEDVIEPDPENPKDPDPTIIENQSFTISNEVTGEMADRDKYFTYDVDLFNPTLVTTPQTYRAYVLDANGNVVTAPANYSGTISNDKNGYPSFVVTTGQPFTAKLKNGQTLVVTDVYVGSTYDANQLKETNYKPSVVVVEDGATPVSFTEPVNTDLSTRVRIIGEKQNSADYTNAYQDPTITGVIINNLPFFMIFALAAAAFIAYIVAKSRKRTGNA